MTGTESATGIQQEGAHFAVATPVGKVMHFESLRALDEVGQVKIADVVANDDVRVRLYDQVPPPL